MCVQPLHAGVCIQINQTFLIPEICGKRAHCTTYREQHSLCCCRYQLLLNESLSSVWAATHAAAIAQSLVLLRACPEVERFFLFCVSCAGDVPTGAYSMWRGRSSPLPAVAAYATAARFTDNDRYSAGGTEVQLGPNVSAVHFKSRSSQHSVDMLESDHTDQRKQANKRKQRHKCPSKASKREVRGGS